MRDAELSDLGATIRRPLNRPWFVAVHLRR
jgi:hypothetical protein